MVLPAHGCVLAKELPLQPQGLPLQPQELPLQPQELPLQPQGLPLQPQGLPLQPQGLLQPQAFLSLPKKKCLVLIWTTRGSCVCVCVGDLGPGLGRRGFSSGAL
uniref:Uncharacterized protein n=1 Tax=Malurus cyaneus samueli TaxID=2593467 RepID=A0A8C5X9D1_9PASS